MGADGAMTFSARQLIALPKRFGSKMPAVGSGPSDTQIDFRLTCDCPGQMWLHVRINRTLHENYSVILEYRPTSGPSTMLARVNGDHGLHKNADGTIVSGPHLHLFPDENMDQRPAPPVSKLRRASPLPADFLCVVHGFGYILQLGSIQPSSKAKDIVEKNKYGPRQLTLQLYDHV